MTDAALDNPDTGSGDQPGAQPASILDTPAQDVPAVPQDWPDSWRNLMAGEDEKELKRLERMKSPADVFKSYRELEKLKSSFSPAPKKPGEGATDDEVKAYREYHGIPDSPDGYDLSFDDGTAIGEDIMPHLKGYLEHAHKAGIPKDQVKATVQYYLQDIQVEQERQYQINDEARVNGTAELRAEWGAEYQGNINSIRSLFTEAPEGVMDALLGARDESGLKFANNPDNIRWLVGIAKQLNPTASLLPTGATDAASIDAELEKLQAQMNSGDPVERDKYWKDPRAQERYIKLLGAKGNR